MRALWRTLWLMFCTSAGLYCGWLAYQAFADHVTPGPFVSGILWMVVAVSYISSVSKIVLEILSEQP